MTGWFRKLLGKGGQPLRQMEPVRLTDQLVGLEGQWIAVLDRKVVAAKHTVDALRLHLHEHDIVGASMMRVPDKGEPELVGLG